MDFYGLSLRPSVVKGIKWNYEKYQNMSKLPYNGLFYPQMTINNKKKFFWSILFNPFTTALFVLFAFGAILYGWGSNISGHCKVII